MPAHRYWSIMNHVRHVMFYVDMTQLVETTEQMRADLKNLNELLNKRELPLFNLNIKTNRIIGNNLIIKFLNTNIQTFFDWIPDFFNFQGSFIL